MVGGFTVSGKYLSSILPWKILALWICHKVFVCIRTSFSIEEPLLSHLIGLFGLWKFYPHLFLWCLDTPMLHFWTLFLSLYRTLDYHCNYCVHSTCSPTLFLRFRHTHVIVWTHFFSFHRILDHYIIYKLSYCVYNTCFWSHNSYYFKVHYTHGVTLIHSALHFFIYIYLDFVCLVTAALYRVV